MKKRLKEFQNFLFAKKASHVGFAIAFVIFIGFVVFLIALIQPSLQVQNSQTNLAENLQERIIQNTSSEITSISLSPEYTRPSENCVDISNLNTKQNKIPKDINGNILNSNTTHIQTSNKENFTKIYTTNESLISTQNPNCNNATQTYETGLIKEKTLIFEEKMDNLISNHSSNYEQLKTDLEVPENNDFEFVFVLENETRKNTSLQEDPQTDIFAISKPITYINKNATKKHGSLETRIW